MHRKADSVQPHQFAMDQYRRRRGRFVCVCGRSLLDYVHSPGARHDAAQREARR